MLEPLTLNTFRELPAHRLGRLCWEGEAAYGDGSRDFPERPAYPAVSKQGYGFRQCGRLLTDAGDGASARDYEKLGQVLGYGFLECMKFEQSRTWSNGIGNMHSLVTSAANDALSRVGSAELQSVFRQGVGEALCSRVSVTIKSQEPVLAWDRYANDESYGNSFYMENMSRIPPRHVAERQDKELGRPVLGFVTAPDGLRKIECHSRASLAYHLSQRYDANRQEFAVGTELFVPVETFGRYAHQHAIYGAMCDVTGTDANKGFEDWQKKSVISVAEGVFNMRLPDAGVSAVRQKRPTLETARAAETEARHAGKPVIGTLRRPDGSTAYRTREGLGYGLSQYYDDKGQFDKSSGVRLTFGASSTDGQLREVYGAICDAKGVPDTDFDTWRQSKVKTSQVGRRLPDTSAIERRTEQQDDRDFG